MIPAEHKATYFGSPTVHYKLYHPAFRATVSGDHQRFAFAELTMWSEASAELFDDYLGHPIAYSKVGDPARLRTWMHDRNRYLDGWLSRGAVDQCNYENSFIERQSLLLGLFEKWLATTPPSSNDVQSPAACAALQSFQPRFADDRDIERFKKLKDSANKGPCAHN